ncbi:MAG: NusG domain II-containing protein [Wujia sp.]
MREQDNNRILNKNDIILFLVVLILALIVLVIFHWTKAPGYQVRLTVDGRELVVLAMDKNQEYVVDNDYGKNVVIIENNRVYVREADCPDKICVDYKPIDEVGETIICLPHRLVIEVVR